MKMKDTVILLILMLSVIGLIIGVYYTEVADCNNDKDIDSDSISEDAESDMTISIEENGNDLSRFFT